MADGPHRSDRGLRLSGLRTDPLRRLAPGTAVLVALALSMPIEADVARGQTGASSPPNILVILTDDQRRDETMQMMPATRRIFGRRGTRFRHAFATTPLCCPSRASLFTGRYAHNHGVLRNGEASELDQDSTIQRYLAEAGYRNGFFGKFLIGIPTEEDPAHFHDWATTKGRAYTDGLWNVQGEVSKVDMYSTDFIAAKSLGFLDSTETEDARPWFLLITPHAPHEPAPHPPRHDGVPLPEWEPNPAMLERDRKDKPPYVRKRQVTLRSQKVVRRRQLRSLPAVDELTGAVFKKMAELDEDDTTLAFFLSDNGMLWGEHGIRRKRHAYTQSVEVPLYARWPGVIAAGVTDKRIVGVLDVPVTIMDAAGIEPSGPPMDGLSMLVEESRDRILLEFFREQGVPAWVSVRTHRYQYVEYYRSDGTISFREYYDLKGDPWQLVNLLHDGDPDNNPDTTRAQARLRSDRHCSGAACP